MKLAQFAKSFLWIVAGAALAIAAVQLGQWTAGMHAESLRDVRRVEESSVPASRRGEVFIEPEDIDFGRVPALATARGTVTITNAADQAVWILRTVSDCGCTAAGLPKRPIEPGYAVDIEVALEMPKRANRQLAETITFILSDDLPSLRVQLHAKSSEPEQEDGADER